MSNVDSARENSMSSLRMACAARSGEERLRSFHCFNAVEVLTMTTVPIMDVPMLRTFIGFILIGVVFYSVYRWILPRIHPFSLIGALLRFGISFTALFLLLAIVFLSPNMRWTLNYWDWIYNISLARVTANPYGAHVFSYITIPLVYFGAFYVTRNEYFSFAFAASTVFLHEMVWFAFTVAFTLLNHGIYQPTLISSTAFAIMITLFGAVILQVYRLNWKWFMLPFIYTLGFDSIWFWANDWRITVSIFDVMGQAQYAATPYYFDFWANMFENIGWLSLFPMMMLVLFFARPKIEELFGRDWDELAKHGWLK